MDRISGGILKTHGEVKLDSDGRRWVITCEPHVAIRLRRWFSKISKGTHGAFRLTASPENSRDLECFLQRFPMVVNGADCLQALAQSHRDRQSLVDDLINRRTDLPSVDLAIPLREYQKIAANVAVVGRHLLLGDDVGLGKTASAIGAIARPEALPALIVTLTHLPLQWKKELNRFAPQLNVHIIKKGQPYDISRNGRKPRKAEENGQQVLTTTPDVIIINYHKLSGWAETLAPLIRSLVWDEVQELRRRDSQKYRAAQHLVSAATYRLGLSATPFYNYGSEMWSVMNCIAPDALGTYEEFSNEWCTNERITNPRGFGAYLREGGFMLRRTRSEVGRELPGLSTIPFTVESDSETLRDVGKSCIDLARTILAQTEIFRGQKLQAGGELDWRLRQATGIAKAPYVCDFVRILLESGEKVVLYGWHRAVYDIWLDKLKEFNPVLYTGTESPQQKEASKAAFVEGDSRVLVMSLRAGAGLDGLQQVCRTVVFGELDWSPGVHEQAAGRIYRDGQSDPVMSYFLVSEEGSDPTVAEVLGLKRGQIEGVRDDKQDLVERLQTDGGHIRRLAEEFLRTHRASQGSEVAA